MVKKSLTLKSQGLSKIEILGCASGIAGANSHCAEGVYDLQKSTYLQTLLSSGLPIQWDVILKENIEHNLPIADIVSDLCNRLAKKVQQTVIENRPFLVIGGDHSCAIGTWSGVADAYKAQGDIGLIWIDAHMDSHTPETSLTQHIHGMPLAALLGYGLRSLTHILNDEAKLKPENICLIGVRSFEAGEAALLKRLNVKIYFMDEVNERGFVPVLEEAVNHVNRHTIGYGVTLDIDSIDPLDAPAVDVPEQGGIRAEAVVEGLKQIASDPRLLTTEIVEFDPVHDKDHMTEKLMINFVEIVANGILSKQ